MQLKSCFVVAFKPGFFQHSKNGLDHVDVSHGRRLRAVLHLQFVAQSQGSSELTKMLKFLQKKIFFTLEAIFHDLTMNFFQSIQILVKFEKYLATKFHFLREILFESTELFFPRYFN